MQADKAVVVHAHIDILSRSFTEKDRLLFWFETLFKII
jgi:hypothetical protein